MSCAISKAAALPHVLTRRTLGVQSRGLTISDLDAPKSVVSRTEEYLSEKGLNAIRGRLFPPGTVLLAMYGSVGKTATAGTEMSTNQAILGIQVRDGSRLDADYLRRWLDSIQSKLAFSASGVTQQNISAKLVRALRIPLPSLAEQRRIAALLDKADEVHLKRQESLRLLDELLQSVFLEMFGDPVRNEKGWKVVTLGDCLLIKPTIGTITPAVSNGEFTVVRVGELGGHAIAVERCSRVHMSTEDEARRCEAREGDLLLARAIGSAAHLGKSSVVGASSPRLVFDSHVMRLRPKPSHLLASFLWQWLQTSGGRHLFLKRGGQTAIQFNVNASQVASVPVPLPPVEEQWRFVRIRHRAQAAAAGIERGVVRATALMDALTGMAFRPTA